MDDNFENNIIMTLDSFISKNNSEHFQINNQLAQLGGGGIVANENKITPEYYQGSKMADYVADFNLNFDLGNVIKYVSRAGKKHCELAIEDLRKAKWYLEHAIASIENKLLGDVKPEWEE